MEKQPLPPYKNKYKRCFALLALIGILANWYVSPVLAGLDYGFDLGEYQLPGKNGLENYFDEAKQEDDKNKGLLRLLGLLDPIKMDWEQEVLDRLDEELRELDEDDSLSPSEIDQVKLFLETIKDQALNEIALWEREVLSQWERKWEVEKSNKRLAQDLGFQAEVSISFPEVDSKSLGVRIGDVDAFSDLEELEGAISQANGSALQEYEAGLKDKVSEDRVKWLAGNPDATPEEVEKWERIASGELSAALDEAGSALLSEGEGIKGAFQRKLEGDLAKGEESWQEVFADFESARTKWEREMESLKVSGEREWEEAEAELAELRRSWQEEVGEARINGEALWSEAESQLESEKELWGSEFEKRRAAGLARWSGLESDMESNRSLAEGDLRDALSEERSRWEGYLGELNDVMLAHPTIDLDELASAYEGLAQDYAARIGKEGYGGDDLYKGEMYSDEEYGELADKYTDLAERMRVYGDRGELLQEGAIKELGYYLATGKMGSSSQIDEMVSSGQMPEEYLSVMESLSMYREKVSLVEEAKRESESKKESYEKAWLEKEEARVLYGAADRHYVDALDQADEAERVYQEAEAVLAEALAQLEEIESRYDELSGSYKEAQTAYNEAIDDKNFAQTNYQQELLWLTSAQREYNKALADEVDVGEEYRAVLESYGNVLEQLNPLQSGYNGILEGYNDLLSMDNTRHGEYNSALIEYLEALGYENDEHGNYNTELGDYVRALGDENVSHGDYNSKLEEYNAALTEENNRREEYNNALEAYMDALGVYGKWGESGTGDGQFDFITGIEVDDSGIVYTVDWRTSRIQKFDSSGGFISSFGGAPFASDIAIDSSENMYVTSVSANAVLKFDSSGNIIPGAELYGGPQPQSVAVDSSDNVYVSYRASHAHKFDNNGNIITTFSGMNSRTGGIAVDKLNNVYITGIDDHRVYKFNSSGTLLTSWGGDRQRRRPILFSQWYSGR